MKKPNRSSPEEINISDGTPTYNPTPVDKLYDPNDDPEDVYDPESAFDEQKSRKVNKIKRSRDKSDEPEFSSDGDSPSPPPPKAPKTSTSGEGFSDLAKKAKENEKKKEISKPGKKDKLIFYIQSAKNLKVKSRSTE